MSECAGNGQHAAARFSAVLKHLAKTLAWFALVLVLHACADASVWVGRPIIPNSPARNNHPNERVLVVVSSHAELADSGRKTGYWLSEVTHFYHALARHGFDLDVVSPDGRPAQMDPASEDLDDPLNRTFLEDPVLRAKLERPLAPAEVDASQYAVIYYAGGHGTMWDFTHASQVATIAREIYERGGIVSAVCHGPSGLLNLEQKDGTKLIAGRNLTGFSNFEERLSGKRAVVPYLLADELVKNGGHYSSALFPFASHVVVDGRLITGQNPASATDVGEAVVRALASTRVGSVPLATFGRTLIQMQ